MRKHLLTTTALAAAGVLGFAGSALAQAKPTISVGGYARQWFGYVDQKDFGEGPLSPKDRSGFATAEDMEVHFKGRVQFDNGIVAGAQIELEGASSTDQIDQSYIYVSGSFGRIQMGAINNVAYLMSYFAPNVGLGMNEVEMYTFLQRPSGDSWSTGASDLLGTARLAFDNDSNKIQYFTPRLYGFQLGASYAPKLQQDADGTDDGTDYRNSWSVAVNYDNKFANGLRLAGNLGYARAEHPLDVGALHLPDIEGWNVGANIKYMGFTIGGEYQDMISGVYVTSKVAGGPGGGKAQAATFGQPSSKGHTYDVGISYDFGPAAVSFTYKHGEAEGLEDFLHPGDIEETGYMFSAMYRLGPGVDVAGSVFWAEYEGDNPTTTSDDNKGVGVVGGIRIAF